MSHETKATGQETPRNIAELSDQELVRRYLDVCNRAMSAHSDSFPFKQIMSLGHRIIGKRPMALGIYKGDGSEPYDYYSFHLEDGMFQKMQHGKAEDAIDWKVKRSYLEAVVEDPDEYIEHPTKLDFDWIKSRLGMDV